MVSIAIVHTFEKRRHIIEYVAPPVSLFQTEYALVFGTRHGVPRFTEEILSLYKGGYFETLIISGGMTQHCAESEALTIFRALVLRGIPGQAMILEEYALNTGQNVTLSRAKVKDREIEELLLIGKVSSKRRYLMTVKQQWPEIRKMCCYGVNYFSVPEECWWKDREFRRRVISEYRKIPSYLERGFVSGVSIINGVVT